MAEVSPSTLAKDDIITSTMRQTPNNNDNNERRTIFGHRSCQSKNEDEEEWKITSSPTKRNMIHKRRDLESRITRMVASGPAGNLVDLNQEQEVRQQAQEGIEDQHDEESRTLHQTHDVDKTQQNRRDSAATDPIQQVVAPFCAVESPLNPKPPHCNKGKERRQTITVSPNLFSLSNSDPNHQQNLNKPNRWRSLDMNLQQSQLPQQQSCSLDTRESSSFQRQHQWQKDLKLSTKNNVHCIVQERIQIQELEKKVSSLLHDLHEAIERETDLEEKVSSLTNENDMLKEQLVQLQKQLNVKSPSSSSSSSNEGTETSSTSVESSQDPLFPDSESLRKEKEGSNATVKGESEQVKETLVPQEHSSEQEVTLEQAQAPEDDTNLQEEPVVQPSEPAVLAVAMTPMTPERPVITGNGRKSVESNGVHEKQVDWTPPAKVSRRAMLQDAHHPQDGPAPRSKGFCIDTCDNSTLSYSLYKGMAEIYDGTVDTGLEGEEKQDKEALPPAGTTAHNIGEEDKDDNWEFLTERVSL